MKNIDDLHVHDISDDDDDDDDDDVECFTVMEPIPSTSNLEQATIVDEWTQQDRPNKLVRSRAPINQKKLNNNNSISNNINNNNNTDTMETSLITIATTSTTIQPMVHQPQPIAIASTSAFAFASTSKAHQQPSTSACIILEPSLLIESSTDIQMVDITKTNGNPSTAPLTFTTAEPELVLSPAKLGQ